MSDGFRTLVIDLDGTLLAGDGTISAEDLAAVQRARDAGLEIIIATGRMLAESRAVLERIEHDGITIVAGGSLMCDARTGATLTRRALEAEVVDTVVARLVDGGHRALVLKESAETGYDYLTVGPHPLAPATRWWFDTLPLVVRDVHHLEADPHPEHTLRAGAVADMESLEPIAEALADELDGRATIQHWAAVTESATTGNDTHLLEVFAHDVSKWTMVAAWCREHGVGREAVAAIGDGLNDVELIQHAGLGVAMGNADPRVLAVADRTTEHVGRGVARAVDAILDGTWRPPA